MSSYEVTPSKAATKSILKTRRLFKRKNKTRKVGWKETASLFHTYTPEEYDRKTPKWKEYNDASQDVTDETTKKNTMKNSVRCSEEKKKEGCSIMGGKRKISLKKKKCNKNKKYIVIS